MANDSNENIDGLGQSGRRPRKTILRKKSKVMPEEVEELLAAPFEVAVKSAPVASAPPAPVAAPAALPEPAVSEPVVTEPAVAESTAEPVGAEPVAESSEPAAPPAPEPVVESTHTEPAAASAAPTAENAEGSELPRKPLYKGLGLGVVALPPGWDPSNPHAMRERVERERAASVQATAHRGRRWVSNDATQNTASTSTYDASSQARGGRRSRRVEVDDTLALRRRKKKSGAAVKASSPQPKAAKRKVRVDGAISVGQLAHELSLKAPVIIKKLMEMGQMSTMNDMLDVDTATLVASEFDYEVENVTFDESSFLQHIEVDAETEIEGEPRPPVVTIMGHVDHGKTTLLDAIRSTRIAVGEAGHITQHIGAYQVERDGQKVTFLDTPGHAAFSAMRARGASLTDIVVLVVAADDGVQPQTIEAIKHAQSAGVPIVVAVNKVDRQGANPDAVRKRLGDYGLIPEEWGGETLFVNVSALKGLGIDKLIEAILLQAEVLELRANPDRPAEGVVIEARMERGRGPVATVLVQQGTLRRGEHVVLGATFGKVRALMDFRGKPLQSAPPSTPAEIFGLSDLPRVGDTLNVVSNEKNARTLAEHRAEAERQAEMSKDRRRTLEDLKRLATETERKELPIVLKADVQGSLEALKSSLEAIEVDGTEVRILLDGVGNLTESDVNLALANNAMLVGFNVKLDARARKVAEESNIQVYLHDVIYTTIDLVTARLKGLREPEYEEQHRGAAEVRAIFRISHVGAIAGSMVVEGVVGRHHGARLYRDGKEIWKGKISQLKRFKDNVREVSLGYECGIRLEGFDDLLEGDTIQTFEMVEIEIA